MAGRSRRGIAKDIVGVTAAPLGDETLAIDCAIPFKVGRIERLGGAAQNRRKIFFGQQRRIPPNGIDGTVEFGGSGAVASGGGAPGSVTTLSSDVPSSAAPERH